MTGVEQCKKLNLLIVGKCKFQDLWLNRGVYRGWPALAQHEFDSHYTKKGPCPDLSCQRFFFLFR